MASSPAVDACDNSSHQVQEGEQELELQLQEDAGQAQAQESQQSSDEVHAGNSVQDSPTNYIPPTALLGYQKVLEIPQPKSASFNNFSKGVKWSADGTTVLACNEDAILRLYSLSTENLQKDASGVDESPQISLTHLACADEGEPVYDFCFYPGYCWQEPATCCFITSSQDHPIHLRDAFTGTLRNSYRPYNNVDEVCHAHSLCWSLDGSRIIGGFTSCIRLFDVQRPGRQCDEWLLSTRKGKGQKGIIAAITPSPVNADLYAAGSYNRSICIYSSNQPRTPVAWLVDKQSGFEMGGLTQLLWASEWLLLSSHRKDGYIRAWDLRKIGSDVEMSLPEGCPSTLLHRFPRALSTHQRFLFSVVGDVLATGDDSGSVLFYSLSQLKELGRVPAAHGRPCVSAMLHPYLDFVISSSGARLFPDYDVASPEPARMCEGDWDNLSSNEGKKRKAAEISTLDQLDNSIRLWSIQWEKK